MSKHCMAIQKMLILWLAHYFTSITSLRDTKRDHAKVLEQSVAPLSKSYERSRGINRWFP